MYTCKVTKHRLLGAYESCVKDLTPERDIQNIHTVTFCCN